SGYLVEIEPGVAADEYYGRTTAGTGHRKIGAMGRARWENATFATGPDWKLVVGKPVVIYGSNDRRGGRIYKWRSAANVAAGMTKQQIRALLDTGTLYVAHFADLDNATGLELEAQPGVRPSEANRGAGRWIRLSVNSTDIAPNATALGPPAKTVGEALQDVNWNGIGGFPDDDALRRALFTAEAKIGVMDLNRPEDVEWNPVDPSGTPRIYVAFTNHGSRTQLNQLGVLDNTTTRPDGRGAIFALEEADPVNPAASTAFTFWQIWGGSDGAGAFAASDPDNIMIDADGGVWFGTDGNFSHNSRTTADAIYYLDLDPSHQETPVPTHGLAFRIAACPSDAEATGPCLSSDMRSLFFNAQHPGESVFSGWPGERSRQ
ncbi:MAG: PhoX family protein, partial [Planctomycetota bacterium]